MRLAVIALALALHLCSGMRPTTPSVGLPTIRASLLRVERDGSTPDVHTLAGAHAAAGPAGGEAASELEAGLISQIFFMCLCMYGGIGLLWAVNIKSGSPEAFRVALLIVSWSSTSVGMHVLNKALVSYLGAPALITAFQMGLTVLVCLTRSWGDLASAPRGELLKWLVVPVFFSGMLISAFYAYAKISLTVLTLVRNLTPLMMLPLEYLVMSADKRPSISWAVVLGIFTMLFGALVYSGGNLDSISMAGIAFAFLNMFLAVTDRLIQRRLLTTECKGLSSSVCTILNNFFGMIPTLLLAGLTGQFGHAGEAENLAKWIEPYVVVLLVLSGLVGTGISILGLECQRAISATSFSVMQNVSKVAVVGAGIVFFLDPVGSPVSQLGLSLSLGGSFLYAFAQQSAAKAAAAKTEKQ